MNGLTMRFGGSRSPGGGAPQVAPRTPGARQRLYQALRGGATVTAAAHQAGISPALADVIIEEMRRVGLLGDATSLCASGLGACHGGDSPEVKIHCAGCPIL